MTDCPYCHGDGWIDMQWGVGYNVTPSGRKVFVSSAATQPVWTREACPECGGTGEAGNGREDEGEEAKATDVD